MTNEEARNKIQNAIRVHENLLTETQMVWPHLKILWHGEDSPAGDSEKEQEGEEDRRRGGKITSRNGQEWIPEGSGSRGKVERYCCNVICGAPTTAKIKGL